MKNRDHILVVARGLRDSGRLDSPWALKGPQPSVSAAAAALGTIPEGDPLFLGGGEPTLRPDLPDLLEQTAQRATLLTDGLALHQPRAVQRLMDSGLHAVRIACHSSRADAHDWLVGIPGAHRRLRQTFKALTEAGVALSTEVVLCRPSTPYLDETVAFLIRSGSTHIHFRMLQRRGAADAAYISLAPRFGLMEPSLSAALSLAMREGISASVEGLPHCALPDFHDLMRPAPIWVCPEGIEAPEQPVTVKGDCPGCSDACAGIPKAYVAGFGWTEVRSEHTSPPAVVVAHPPPVSGDIVDHPPGRGSRWPATRVLNAITQAAHPNLGGDPMAGRAPSVSTDTLAVNFPVEASTRTIRTRLVRAAQEGASTLQILGPMDHPEAMTLLRETLRLSFQRVFLCGDLRGLAETPASQFFHLRGLTALWSLNDPENAAIAGQIVAASGVTCQPFTRLTDAKSVQEHREAGTTGAFVCDAGLELDDLEPELKAASDQPRTEALCRALTSPPRQIYGPPGTPLAAIRWPKPDDCEVQ